jgi:hypothetical protein
MHMNLRMRLEELFNRSGLVGGEIVGDDVNFFAARLVDDDVGEKGDELSGGVPRAVLPKTSPVSNDFVRFNCPNRNGLYSRVSITKRSALLVPWIVLSATSLIASYLGAVLT